MLQAVEAPKTTQDNILVGCALPTCQPYVFHWAIRTMGGGIAPQVNKFEQVSSDDHQISVAGEDSSQGGLPRSAV